MKYPVIVADLFKVDHVYTKSPITQQVWTLQGFTSPCTLRRPRRSQKPRNKMDNITREILLARRSQLVESPLEVSSAFCHRTIKSLVSYYSNRTLAPCR